MELSAHIHALVLQLLVLWIALMVSFDVLHGDILSRRTLDLMSLCTAHTRHCLQEHTFFTLAETWLMTLTLSKHDVAAPVRASRVRCIDRVIVFDDLRTGHGRVCNTRCCTSVIAILRISDSDLLTGSVN